MKKLFWNSAELKTLALCAAVATLASPQAFASHHHISIKADTAGDTPSACVFPDGTSPAGQPELHCYGVPDFLKAYGIDAVHAMGLTGKGQTIVLADSWGSPTLQADLDHFSQVYNLPQTTIKMIYPNGPVYPNGTPTDMTSDQVGWAEETTLDLEWAHAVAPDATLVNIATTSSESTGMSGFADLFAGIQTVIGDPTDYPNAIISMSMGTGESTFVAADITASLQGTFHTILQNATNAGITVLASAGDSGSTNPNTAQTSLQAFPDASYPATDPLITAVGGTAIESGWRWDPQGTADQYWACQLSKAATCPTDFLASVDAPGQTIETVWKEDWALAAGGGGVSKIYGAPDFQAQLPSSVLKLAAGKRTIPDVSLNAAINGGVNIYMSFVSPANGANGPQWQTTGGTSCASPETAGLVALAGQLVHDDLVKAGKTPVSIGGLNALLYGLPSADFNDIVPQTLGATDQVTIGDDSLFFSASVLAAVGPTHMPPVAVMGYQTAVGYDAATGIGTPKAALFVVDLAKAREAAIPGAPPAVVKKKTP